MSNKKRVTDRDFIAKNEVKNIASNYQIPTEAIVEAQLEVGNNVKRSRSKRLVFKALAAAGFLMITRYMRKKLANKP